MRINPEAIKAQAISLHEVFGKAIPEVEIAGVEPDWRLLRRTLNFIELPGDVIKKRSKHRAGGSRVSEKHEIPGRIMVESELEGMGGDYWLDADFMARGHQTAGTRRINFGGQDFSPVTLGQIAPELQRIR